MATCACGAPVEARRVKRTGRFLGEFCTATDALVVAPLGSHFECPIMKQRRLGA